MNTDLNDVVRALIFHCRSRCGIGFGKYPLGMRDAIAQLLPLVNQDVQREGRSIRELVADLDERLSR
jgi:hypothetical protein